MRIDADSNGSVEWHEFMNYMLLENITLSSMKQEHSEYVKSSKPDPAPHKPNCHSDMITCTIIITPEDIEYNPERPDAFKRKMKYATASRDGTVKIWNAHTMKLENNGVITVVKDIWVTCIHYMTYSKRLVAASANRMISFYDLSSTQYGTPTSRIEGLVGIPLCLEYYKWPESNQKSDGKYETLLVGDDLGICKMYTFTEQAWHMCQYKLGSHVGNMTCHAGLIQEDFKTKVDEQFAANEEKKKMDRKNLNKRKVDTQGEQ